MKPSITIKSSMKLTRVLIGGLMAICLACGGSAFAVSDYIFFTVNGDSALPALTQGDTLSWGANCTVGTEMHWEIWYDVDNDALIDEPGDLQMESFFTTDGDTSNDYSIGDTDPVPDGWFITPEMILGLEPGQYIFRVTDLTDSTSITRALTNAVMPSPPNQISGRISIAGHPAPDILLGNVWLDSESDTVDVGFYNVLTDVNGYYEINIGAIGTDVLFEVFPSDIPGFVTPAPQPVVVSGAVGNIDFAYAVPADSLFGVLKDDAGTIITSASELWCEPRFAGVSGKNAETDAGAYKFYFSAAEQGEWEVGVSADFLIPDYLIPSGFSFNNDTANSFEHDFVCPRTDTVLYIKVTENGGLPTNNYLVYTFSNTLFATTQVVSGTGSDNVATLHISSLDMSTWSAWLSDWDDNYPIPAGFVVEGGPNPEIGPGDTATINLISGHTIIDTVTQDPEDGPIVWSDVWVGLSAENSNYGAEAGAGGVFTVTADTGTYTMTANADGYLADPTWRTVVVTGDTTGGLGFTINKTHCRVAGSLTNVATPLDGLTHWVTARTGSGSSGYITNAQVDNATGTYTLWLCDGDWTITAPFIDTYISPANANLVIGEMPDTLRTLDLVYTVVSGVNDNPDGSLLPTEFALAQNYPNPFNPKTQIRFDLPQRSHVVLSVYNVLGQEVAKIWKGDLNAGSHALEWDGNDASGNQAASGIYFYRLKAGDFVDSKKMILLK